MPASSAPPVVRPYALRTKSPLFLAPIAAAGVRHGAAPLTEDRSPGVGAPADPLLEPDGALPTQALVCEAVETALESLDTLERQARDVARRFRRRALDEAQFGLSHLVQSTQTLVRLATMTADATGTTLEALCETHALSAPTQTSAAVSELIREQLAQDWHGLAAAIDQSFTDALRAWRAVFHVVGGPSADPYGTAA